MFFLQETNIIVQWDNPAKIRSSNWECEIVRGRMKLERVWESESMRGRREIERLRDCCTSHETKAEKRQWATRSIKPKIKT